MKIRTSRTLFNEAVIYEWITKKLSVKLKYMLVVAMFHCVLLVKKIFPFQETRDFLSKLNSLSEDFIHHKTILKFMLLTGVGTDEMLRLRWSNIDFE